MPERKKKKQKSVEIKVKDPDLEKLEVRKARKPPETVC